MNNYFINFYFSPIFFTRMKNTHIQMTRQLPSSHCAMAARNRRIVPCGTFDQFSIKTKLCRIRARPMISSIYLKESLLASAAISIKLVAAIFTTIFAISVIFVFNIIDSIVILFQ